MLALAAMALPACGDGAEELAATELRIDGSPRARNLVLIVNDAMRRDRVGVYGGPAQTPHFDAFARDGLLFWRAYSASPWTKPSMVSLLTSLHPSQHGIVSHPRLREGADRTLERSTDVLADGFTTLPELLCDAGYATAAFVGNPWLRREFGFAQGFEEYDDSLAGWDVPGEVVTDRGLAWLETADRERPFFLYLHYMDSHRPYGRLRQADIEARLDELRADRRPLSEWAAQDIENSVMMEGGGSAATVGIAASVTLLEMAYDRGVEEFDRALGRFLASLDAGDLREETAVVVVSDHGEALHTRGWGNHGVGLYEDEVAIPLAARLPGVALRGDRVESPVGLVDLLPTLCGYLGVKLPAEVRPFGVDWLAPVAVAGRIEDRYLLIEGVMRSPANRAVRFGEHKAIWQPDASERDPLERGLFLVDEDPGETRNLLSADSSAAAIYRRLLEGATAASPRHEVPQTEDVTIDPEVVERLRALGYIK